jgi:hypothetical protein
VFIIIKNAAQMTPNFGDALRSVTENIFQTLDAAQQAAMVLANANSGVSYTVFELVMLGTAIALPPAPIVNPPAIWMPVVNPVI